MINKLKTVLIIIFYQDVLIDNSSQTPDCLECAYLSSQVRQLKSRIIDFKLKIKEKDDNVEEKTSNAPLNFD